METILQDPSKIAIAWGETSSYVHSSSILLLYLFFAVTHWLQCAPLIATIALPIMALSILVIPRQE